MFAHMLHLMGWICLSFQINGQVLYGRCHLNASAIIKGVTTRKVKIILLRSVPSLLFEGNCLQNHS